MERTYYDTKRVCRFGRSLIIHIDKWWGFDKGDVVEIKLYDIDNPNKRIYATKKLCKTGNSLSIFVELAWGFEQNDIVILKLKAKDNNDSGIEAEEEYQDLP